MYSLRYGTVPVVRSTGGLYDTVEPWDPATGRGTGFRFDNPDGTGLMWALDQALATFKDRAGLGAARPQRDGEGLLVGPLGEAYVDVYRRAIGEDLIAQHVTGKERNGNTRPLYWVTGV
jgi:starch synthase